MLPCEPSRAVSAIRPRVDAIAVTEGPASGCTLVSLAPSVDSSAATDTPGCVEPDPHGALSESHVMAP